MDFDTFTLNGPSDTSETDGGKCQDSLTITTVNIIKSIVILLLIKGKKSKKQKSTNFRILVKVYLLYVEKILANIVYLILSKNRIVLSKKLKI